MAKPAILCLHGSGTNAMIFRIQLVRIQRILSSTFDFVFLDAPFEVGPGPGVLPIFEGCGPYFRWIAETNDTETPPATRDLIAKAFAKQKAEDGRGFVGVIGFSQGCRVVAGLLLEQQADKKNVPGEGLLFGVFTMGTVPPLTFNLEAKERAARIDFPTLHVVGLADNHRMHGKKMWEDHVVLEKAVYMEVEEGHRLPTREEDSDKIAQEIIRMYKTGLAVGQGRK